MKWQDVSDDIPKTDWEEAELEMKIEQRKEMRRLA